MFLAARCSNFPIILSNGDSELIFSSGYEYFLISNVYVHSKA